MNGVDVADQLTVFYSFVHKSRKWWRKTVFWLFEVAVVNSYLLYKGSVARPKSHLDYRRAVIAEFATASIQLSAPRPGPGAPRRSTSELQWLDHKPHFMEKAASDQDCVICSSRGGGEEAGGEQRIIVEHAVTTPLCAQIHALKNITPWLTIGEHKHHQLHCTIM